MVPLFSKFRQYRTWPWLVCLGLSFLFTACSPVEYWIPPSSAGAWAALSTPTSTQETSTPIDPGNAADSSTPFPETAEESAPPGASGEFAEGALSTRTPTGAPDSPVILYYAQAADTLPVVAVRFGVTVDEIVSEEPLPAASFLQSGQLLVIPRRLDNTTSSEQLIPDSEFVYSPSATDFDVRAFVLAAGGKLSSHREWHKSTGFIDGAGVVQLVAIENSVNPRLLLSLLEYDSGWVYGYPATANAEDYPLGLIQEREKGLYNQLVWAVNQLSTGYYAWREGRLTELTFPDGSRVRLAPELNAGTAALLYYFAQKSQGQDWLNALDPNSGLPALHFQMFGDPWERARVIGPLYPHDIRQPALTLPFQRGWVWAFTGGPHGAWERDGAYAAIDFAPGSTESGCVRSSAWVVAATDGLVVRSGNGLVVLDLDGDGYEQTGWVLVYLHVSSEDRIPVGSWVGTGDNLGHPSCEGGISTGTHVHLARKYNGEWIPAAGPLPFNLGGWIAQPSDTVYKGTLVRGDQVVTASTYSVSASFIERGPDDP
jgi:murein DD-endopeptidase MepM/ murein hydrolase activator NlpD